MRYDFRRGVKREHKKSMHLLLVQILAGILLISAFAFPALAAKPAGNLAGANKVGWNLSSAVMPVPPYGSQDITGSDSASKLIVNQPNGNTQATVTGSMNGLNPNTTYTVYLSKGYTKYVDKGWNVTGTYAVNVGYLGVNYPETLVLNQSGNSITGYIELVGGGSRWTITSGSVVGTSINFEGYFNSTPSMHIQFTGTIASDGTMNGTWGDIAPGTRTGTWSTVSWSLDGSWNIDFNSTMWPSGNPYAHSLSVNGSTATGSSTGNNYNATVNIDGNNVTITATYLPGSSAYPYTYTAVGTISTTGTISGTWSDTLGDSGTWASTTGGATALAKASHEVTGSTGWPGLFNNNIQPLTFMTDEYGSGSWHLNLKGADLAPGSNYLSVWINSNGGTMLISDQFIVIK